MENITKAIEAEIATRVQEALTRYAEMISVTHKISLPLLLRDLPASMGPVSTSCCLGVKKDGTRCNKTGKYDGYCLAHLDQRKKVQPVRVCQEGPAHNHGVPPIYSDTCPACNANAPSCQPKSKLLIDLKGLI
jgi:hypothetical protein